MGKQIHLHFEDRLPIQIMRVYQTGAVVNGDQSMVNTVTVHSGHNLQVGDKFLYAESRSNCLVFRGFDVTAVSGNDITFSDSAWTFSDKALLLDVGTDTGLIRLPDNSYTPPNWDGSPVAVYADPALESQYDDAAPPVDRGGGTIFFVNEDTVWVVGISASKQVTMIWQEMGSGSFGGGGSSVTRGAAFPSSPSLGDQHLLTGGADGDVLYAYMTLSDASEDWIEVSRAP